MTVKLQGHWPKHQDPEPDPESDPDSNPELDLNPESDPDPLARGTDPQSDPDLNPESDADPLARGADLDPYQNVTDPQHCLKFDMFGIRPLKICSLNPNPIFTLKFYMVRN